MTDPRDAAGALDDFVQSAPCLDDQWESDRVLRSYLRRVLPTEMLREITPQLARLGARAAGDGDILALGEAAEARPPRHVPYDAWGRRVDIIETADAWRALDRISAEEGLVAIAYERAHGALSRVHQMAALHLFSPSSATYSCPLAMTDGAARCLELYAGDDPRLRAALAHLVSRDPRDFWTSGQWMTERAGGSDVSRTATIARPDGEAYRLYGSKWFTSATTSQMAMTLARVEGAPPGSRGLSLFQLELRDASGALNGIRVEQLKDKLGTRALPTAELTLDGARAVLVGGAGHGVRKIAALFNITRIQNACAAVAGMRRAVALARDYARRRVAFGRPIADHAAHVSTLAAMQVEAEGAFHLAFRVVELLGRAECGLASEREGALLRLLTPVVKLYTARQAVRVASEALEAFGGAGYIESTGLPRLLRDAQVLSIWEGTTNVLALDLLRAIDGGSDPDVVQREVAERLAGVSAVRLAPAVARVRAAVERTTRAAHEGGAPEARETRARSLAFAVARCCIGALLLEHAQWSLEHESDRRASIAAMAWCAREMGPREPAPTEPADARVLALDEAALPPGIGGAEGWVVELGSTHL
ncbi:MAG TPA: acyl-CoA dehydrogenase family protein [Gemmatimonadaceae bacterium]